MMSQNVKFKKRVRSGISGLLSGPLVWQHQRRVDHGELLAVPTGLWGLLPKRVKKWTKYRVLNPVEDYAWKCIEQHEILNALFSERPGRAAISPSTILFLWHLLNRERPRSVLEFGGGSSTLVFGAYARAMHAEGETVKVLSADHDRHWLEETRRNLTAAGVEEYIYPVYAPLSVQKLLDRDIEAYTIDSDTLEEASGERGFDICFIDGPPRRVGRTGSLPLARPYLATNATILLDDANRGDERAILKEWKAAYGSRMSRPQFLSNSHALALIYWREREPCG